MFSQLFLEVFRRGFNKMKFVLMALFLFQWTVSAEEANLTVDPCENFPELSAYEYTQSDCQAFLKTRKITDLIVELCEDFPVLLYSEPNRFDCWGFLFTSQLSPFSAKLCKDIPASSFYGRSPRFKCWGLISRLIAIARQGNQ